MRIAAALHQQLRDAVVPVVERYHDRTDAFRSRQIHVRTCGHQSFHAAVTTPASRVQERGESAIRVILGARLRRNLARPVAVFGARVQRGALRDQHLHHLRRVAGCRRRPHQRRLLLNLLDDIDAGAGVDEHLEHRQLAVLDGDHQRCLAVSVGRLRSGAGAEQRLHDTGVALPDRFRQRRVAELVRHIDPGFLRDQYVHQFVVDAVHRPMNRQRPVGLSLIHVGARLDHRQRGSPSSFLDYRGQLPGLCLRQNRRRRSKQQECGNESETVHGAFHGASSPTLTRHRGPACCGSPTGPSPPRTETGKGPSTYGEGL